MLQPQFVPAGRPLSPQHFLHEPGVNQSSQNSRHAPIDVRFRIAVYSIKPIVDDGSLLEKESVTNAAGKPQMSIWIQLLQFLHGGATLFQKSWRAVELATAQPHGTAEHCAQRQLNEQIVKRPYQKHQRLSRSKPRMIFIMNSGHLVASGQFGYFILSVCAACRPRSTALSAYQVEVEVNNGLPPNDPRL